MRVYAPATPTELDRLRRDGSWLPSAGAFAVTPALREWVIADGPADDEQLELAALSEAARDSLRLLGPLLRPEQARRVVLALDLDPGVVEIGDEGPDDPPGRVGLTVAGPMPLARVASLHVDEDAAGRAVASAAAAVSAADGGDPDAEAVVAALDDHELLWYHPAELAGLTGGA